MRIHCCWGPKPFCAALHPTVFFAGRPFHHFALCLARFVSTRTDLTFSWILNAYPSFVKQDARRFVSQKTGNLYIAKVEPSDVGNYTCVVTNTVTKSSVQGPPTPLVLRSDGETILGLRRCCVCLGVCVGMTGGEGELTAGL